MQSLWILICLSIVREFSSGKEKLYIGTFYGVNVSSIGWSSEGVMPAVQMALDHVNKDQSILPEYTLHEDWRDSKVTLVPGKPATLITLVVSYYVFGNCKLIISVRIRALHSAKISRLFCWFPLPVSRFSD